MCLAVVGTVVALEGEGALVQVDGRTRWASMLLCPEVAPGDHVLVSALSIVDRVSPEEAVELQALRAALAGDPVPGFSGEEDIP